MTEDLQNFLHYLQQLCDYNKQKIELLEQEVATLRKEVQAIKDNPPVRIDKIEYKFDQLKVETLDGTLNIGLHPGGLEDIDEFAVNNENVLTPFLFPARDEVIHHIMAEMTRYLQSEKEQLFKNAELQTGKKVDEGLASFMLEDITRQLPQRIQLYLDRTPPYDRSADKLNGVVEHICETVKTDIDQAIFSFMEHYPGQGEGT